MKVPISWLKDFVDIDVTANELAHKLTMTSLEVEAVEEIGKSITNVIIGLIKKIEKHPNADKLQVCTVFDGQNDLQLITAATNVAEGQKIPIAIDGAKLATGVEIKKTKLRGVDSFGMMCSPIELGISTDAKGIMILPEDAPLGANAVEYLDLDETILDVFILPNRADCLSMTGIAREVGAALNKKPDWNKLNININEAEESILAKVEVIDKDLCPRYMAREIKDIKIGPSPKWMQKRLKSYGIRPINNVVDITNYVLVEMGQPLHAFDFDCITGGKIVVRRAKNGEKIITLDEIEREVNSEDLLITDVGRPLALAGVMGGAGSEVKDTTNHILLESAYFNPVNIRRTSFKLGHRTESSQRFERGVDWNGVERALDRAAYLLQEYAEGKVLKGKIDIKDENYGNEKTGKYVLLNINKVNSLLGINLTKNQIKESLSLLDFKVEEKENDQLKVAIPSWRVDDVFREVDLCEEAVRLYGYDNIASTLPSESIPVEEKSKIEIIKSIIKEILLGSGLHEIITYNLVPENNAKTINKEDLHKNKVFLDNPLSSEDAVLRNNMIYSHIHIAKENIYRQNVDFGYFEFGKTFFNSEDGISEKPLAAGIICGRIKVDCDFYYLKGILEQICEKLLIKEIYYEESNHPSLQQGKSAVIKKDKEILGVFGEVGSQVRKNFDISNNIYYFEIDLENLVNIYNPAIKFQKISLYPESVRDIAILIDNKTKYDEVISVLNESDSKILRNIELFDKYTADIIGKDKISLAFHLVYGSQEKTLTEEEISEEHDRLKKLLVKKLRAEIR